MKCENCNKDKSEIEWCGIEYCYKCLSEHVNNELREEAIELWIEQNTRKLT